MIMFVLSNGIDMLIMKKQNLKITEEPLINQTHLTLRRNLGIIGIALPPLLIALNKFTILPSLSHYYYSESNVLFIGLLFAFGLYLFSYRGYKMDKSKRDFIDDNWITNLAGILIIIVAFIPTGANPDIICKYHLFNAPRGHNNNIYSTIHLLSAAGFFLIMAYLSYFRFTRSNNCHKTQQDTRVKKRRNNFYKASAIIIVLSLVFIFVFDFLSKSPFSEYIVIIGETMALFAFGSSWLIKSKSLYILNI